MLRRQEHVALPAPEAAAARASGALRRARRRRRRGGPHRPLHRPRGGGRRPVAARGRPRVSYRRPLTTNLDSFIPPRPGQRSSSYRRTCPGRSLDGRGANLAATSTKRGAGGLGGAGRAGLLRSKAALTTRLAMADGSRCRTTSTAARRRSRILLVGRRSVAHIVARDRMYVRQAPRINRYAPRKRVFDNAALQGGGAGLLPDAAQEIGGEASGVTGSGFGSSRNRCSRYGMRRRQPLSGTWG